MFGEKRIVVLDGTLLNEEMRPAIMASLRLMKESDEKFFIFEEKPDADTRCAIEKHAHKSFRFESPKKEKDNSIFALANALKKADKKTLWVAYQRQLAKGEAPEAMHGVLFWGAKDMFLKSREGGPERARASKLISELSELPHEARRNGLDLEYALERFILSVS